MKSENPQEFGALSPMLELGAYEWLWQQNHGQLKPSFKSLAALLESHSTASFSDFVDAEQAKLCAEEVLKHFKKRGLKSFSIRFSSTGDFPVGLRDADHPVGLLYYRGNWDLVYTPQRIAIVGSRSPSDEGLRRAAKLSALLVKAGVTVVSGLAKGIDTAAHQAAINHGGNTIAVIGTPIDQVYPKDNRELQEFIATEHLLISQVPVLQYQKRPPAVNRIFFPERNITMSALTQATVIVEAGDTSGSLIQARAALKQGRKLFILENNFHKKTISWPSKYEQLGAIRVSEFSEILCHLNERITPTRDRRQ